MRKYAKILNRKLTHTKDNFMVQEIFVLASTISFFNSLAFGIIALVLVGGSWCLVGLVMGDAPKRGVDTSLVQFFGGFVSVIVSLIIAGVTDSWETGVGSKMALLACSSFILSGFMNFFMLQFMSKAMQTGPNGVIWSIIQSGCVSPFICSIVLFEVVDFTWLRAIGIICLLAALVLFVFTKNNDSKGGNLWKLYAFICFAIVSVQQNLMVWPSYYEATKEVSSIVRALCVAGGTLIASILYNVFKMSTEQKQKIKQNITSKMLWVYVLTLQFFSLIFAYTLFYPGMDVMANHGRGGMCYPMMVGSCIVFFTIMSVLLLKERIRLIQLAAIVVCITGLILICTGV